MSEYVKNLLAQVKAKNPNEPEFQPKVEPDISEADHLVCKSIFESKITGGSIFASESGSILASAEANSRELHQNNQNCP